MPTVSNQDKAFIHVKYEDKKRFCKKLGIKYISLRSVKKKYPHAVAVKRQKRVRNSPYIIVIQKNLKITNMKVFGGEIKIKGYPKILLVSSKTKKDAYELLYGLLKLSYYKFDKYWKRTRKVKKLQIATDEGIWVYDKISDIYVRIV